MLAWRSEMSRGRESVEPAGAIHHVLHALSPGFPWTWHRNMMIMVLDYSNCAKMSSFYIMC